MSAPVKQSSSYPIAPPAPRPKRTKVKLTEAQKERLLAAHHKYQASILALKLKATGLNTK